MGKKRKNPLDFEAAMARLEEIVEKLEEGGMPLRDSLALFEEGQELSRRCEGELDAAEDKVAVLISRGAPGAGAERDIEIGPDDDVSEALAD